MKDCNIDLKKWTILVLITALVFWAVNNVAVVLSGVAFTIDMLYPFILGGVIAFILNIPMTKAENFLLKKMKNPKKGAVRGLSITFALLLFVAIIAFVAFLLIPELVENIKLLISHIPGLVNDTQKFIVDFLDKYPDVQTKVVEMLNNSMNIGSIVGDLLNSVLNGAIGFISSLVSSVITLFTAIIFAVYILSQKEYLQKGVKKFLYAYLNKKKADKIINVGKLSNSTFAKFISGQCVEAVILGFIFFVILSIFRFPYALLISVLTTITALIPIFGAFIAMAVGAILIAITSPIKALIFIAVFLVIQQIEGNFIYPKVVGKSVGLSPIWTLVSISVGGSLFGIPGMLIGLPIASIIYALLRVDAAKRLETKNIKI